jgi:hypothetical protein
MSISSLVVSCLEHFVRLLASDSLAVYESEVRKDLWQDELGRLRVWAANIGAHQTGQSSLEFRLRDASHIKDQTVKLLRGLQKNLNNLDEVLAEPAPDGDTDSQFSEDGTEVQQTHKGLVDSVDCLFRMSMAIRRPAPHNRLMGMKQADALGFEPFDRQHVLEKYPSADSTITDRLGAAISRRRATLKYRERHHEKLKVGIDRIGLSEQSDAISTKLSETIATEYDNTCPTLQETASDSGASQTSYAQTLLGGGASGDIVSNSWGWLWRSGMTEPPLPKEAANGMPFECPYCYFIITAPHSRSWARHVFRDLMPYVCLFPDCKTPNRLYESRREWFRHCQSAHAAFGGSETIHDCPLCKEPISGVAFQRHLGRHLEELALFALPRAAVSEDAGISDDSCTTSGTGVIARTVDSVSEDQKIDADDDTWASIYGVHQDIEERMTILGCLQRFGPVGYAKKITLCMYTFRLLGLNLTKILQSRAEVQFRDAASCRAAVAANPHETPFGQFNLIPGRLLYPRRVPPDTATLAASSTVPGEEEDSITIRDMAGHPVFVIPLQYCRTWRVSHFELPL